MKKCPQCGTQYSDDTLSYCLQDGTSLAASDAGTPTVVLGETETVPARRDDRIQVPVGDPNTRDAWGQSQATRVASPQPAKKGSNTVLAVALTAVGMLLLFGFVGITAIVFFRNSQQAGPQIANLSPNANVSGSNTNYSSYPTPLVSASPMRTSSSSTPISTPQSSPVTTPPPPPPILSSYPSTTRLKFARGAYSTSFGGDLNPGDSRSLVLGCRSGQSLSANVSSAGGCVTFRGSGSSLRTTTNGGDNYLALSNHCSSVVQFSVSITII